jgi:hypothetical protein
MTLATRIKRLEGWLMPPPIVAPAGGGDDGRTRYFAVRIVGLGRPRFDPSCEEYWGWQPENGRAGASFKAAHLTALAAAGFDVCLLMDPKRYVWNVLKAGVTAIGQHWVLAETDPPAFDPDDESLLILAWDGYRPGLLWEHVRGEVAAGRLPRYRPLTRTGEMWELADAEA